MCISISNNLLGALIKTTTKWKGFSIKFIYENLVQWGLRRIKSTPNLTIEWASSLAKRFTWIATISVALRVQNRLSDWTTRGAARHFCDLSDSFINFPLLIPIFHPSQFPTTLQRQHMVPAVFTPWAPSESYQHFIIIITDVTFKLTGWWHIIFRHDRVMSHHWRNDY